MKKSYDVIITGSGPSGLGAAFHLAENSKKSILLVDRARVSTGGLRNDCKQNYTFPVGFPEELWNQNDAESLLEETARHLRPEIQESRNLETYIRRAEKLGVELLRIKQCHVGTDKSIQLISSLTSQLKDMGVDISLETEVSDIDCQALTVAISRSPHTLSCSDLVLAPGRNGAMWLQNIMQKLGISYKDNIVDVGVRIEGREENYPIVKDYYDPKFLFPEGVRTFCTNSGAAFIVKEKYEHYYSVNGHSFSTDRKPNGLINFAMLKTIHLTDPVVSGHQFAAILGQMAMQLSGGQPMMQRIGDFRLGKRSKSLTFNDDLYNFEPTLKGATPGDITLAMPAKILRSLWKSMKMLDTIVPGVLHPSTIIYYPEIKTYGNKPEFMDRYFQALKHIYMIGDGAGTSRGITAAWASGIRAAQGILKGGQ